MLSFFLLLWNQVYDNEVSSLSNSLTCIVMLFFPSKLGSWRQFNQRLIFDFMPNKLPWDRLCLVSCVCDSPWDSMMVFKTTIQSTSQVQIHFPFITTDINPNLVFVFCCRQKDSRWRSIMTPLNCHFLASQSCLSTSSGLIKQNYPPHSQLSVPWL